MRVWTAVFYDENRVPAKGWEIHCDDRLVFLISTEDGYEDEDKADVKFVLDACNAAEQRAEADIAIDETRYLLFGVDKMQKL